MKIIKFTNSKDSLNLYPPGPASREVPEWYKKTESYTDGKQKIKDSKINFTIKKCIPIFDAITTGYILYSQADVSVTCENGLPFYQWPSQNQIEFHPLTQAPIHPLANDAPYPKWNNPWSVKTPKGYSTLFIQPLNRESVFTILPGIVDTDAYNSPVNFPFVLNDIKWEGIIPAGTPIAQAIPFKRDNFIMKKGSKKDKNKILHDTIALQSLFLNKYKNLFWKRKEYR